MLSSSVVPKEFTLNESPSHPRRRHKLPPIDKIYHRTLSPLSAPPAALEVYNLILACGSLPSTHTHTDTATRIHILPIPRYHPICCCSPITQQPTRGRKRTKQPLSIIISPTTHKQRRHFICIGSPPEQMQETHFLPPTHTFPYWGSFSGLPARLTDCSLLHSVHVHSCVAKIFTLKPSESAEHSVLPLDFRIMMHITGIFCVCVGVDGGVCLPSRLPVVVGVRETYEFSKEETRTEPTEPKTQTP